MNSGAIKAMSLLESASVAHAMPVVRTGDLRARSVDARLVRRAKEGDREAMVALMQRREKALHRYFCRLGRSPSDADDLLQDLFVQFLKSLPRLADDSNLSAWLFRVGTNLFLKSRRKAMRGAERPENLIDPEDREKTRELGELLLGEIRALPEKQRVVVLLRFEEGLDHRTIAEVLEESVENVRWHLCDARRKLRARLNGKIG